MKRRERFRAWVTGNRRALKVLVLAGLLAAGVPVYLATPAADIAVDTAAGVPDGSTP